MASGIEISISRPSVDVPDSPANPIKRIDAKIMGLFPIRPVTVQGCFSRKVQNLQVPERFDSVVSTLRNEFGDEIVDRILKKYDLEKKEFLSLDDYKAIRIGIAANINYNDLKRIYSKSLRMNREIDQEGFDDVTDQELYNAFSNFRKDVPIEDWTKDFEDNTDLPYHNKVMNDLAVLKTCDEAKQYVFSNDQSIAAGEHLSHDVAYVDLEEGQIIPVKDDAGAGGMKLTKVSRVINENGMVCFILTPLQERQNAKDFKVRVLFRGTHDSKSFKRLYEPFSAGHLSFKHHHKNLMDQISTVVPPSAENVSIASYGHSLGGADAQRFTALMAFSIARIRATAEELQASKDELGGSYYERPYAFVASPDWDKIRSTVSKIKNVAMCVYNSAGIAHTTNELFKNAVKAINLPRLEGDQKEGDAKPVRNCTFKVTHCKVGGDFVQQVGETSLAHELEFDPSIVEREVIQFQHGYEGIRGFFASLGLSSLYAHTIKNLNGRVNKGIEPTHDYWNAKDNKDAVNKATGYHQTWLNILWQKIKWYVMAFFFGSSLFYKKTDDANGVYYRPWDIPEGALI